MKFSDAFKLGTVVGIISALISWLVQKFFSGIFNLQTAYASVPLTSGVSSTWFNKVAAIFTGFGFDIASFIILWISAIILVFVGGWLQEYLVPKASGWMKYFWIIFLGTVLGYIIFVGFVFKVGIMGVVGAVIYALIVAFLAGYVYPMIFKK